MHILRHENDDRFSDESAYSPTCSWSTSLATGQRRDILRPVVRIQPKLTLLCCQIALGDSFGGFGPTKKATSPEQKLVSPPTPTKIMKVKMWLRVENNSKFVRGKGKVREEIERFVLQRFGMEKASKDSHEYLLSIPYTTDEELDRIIYDEIWREAESIADGRNCFTEGDMTSLEDPDRRW